MGAKAPLGTFIMKICDQCAKEKRPEEMCFSGICVDCFEANKTRDNVKVSIPYFREMGVENPEDPKGSTAHVRDIKMRRLDTKTKQMYYERPRRTYI